MRYSQNRLRKLILTIFLLSVLILYTLTGGRKTQMINEKCAIWSTYISYYLKIFINFKINVKWAHVSQGSFRGKKKRWYLHLVIISFFWKLQDLKCHCFFYTSWPMGYFIQLWWITCHPSGHVPDVTNLRSKYLELNGLLDCFDLNKARRPSEAFWRKEYTNFETLRKLELLN